MNDFLDAFGCGAADDPALGAPVEYIDLRGTSYDNPMVCKYTGAELTYFLLSCESSISK